MKLSLVFPLTSLLSLTVAGSLTTDEVSPCLTHCLTEGAAVAGCTSYLDLKCTCPSPAFKDALGVCLKDVCEKKDLEAAKQLHVKRCGTAPQ
ncbi:hypothetical protein NUU61_008665 [Penicillium alfredii]|uniref:CFEM domain-containing protein n=1 Tax=Penicillium alfredii TaxID=1506179 RepID=A0A9W9ELW6_9EURO|nr:uncharacterized protein NUU61_008665 [Penicillium alfredii]KAJ5084086.1 hypothetical protein NUU61_008665 [Penicillium alfredii]